MSPILVTLTSCSDSNLECSNISLKENRPDCVDLTSDGLDFCVRKKENFCGLRQTFTIKIHQACLGIFEVSTWSWKFHLKLHL